MAVCDICNTPGMGTVIGAEDVRKAVFKNGFNPFKLGLGGEAGAAVLAMMGLSNDDAYRDWKGRVAQDTSDWNICPKCMGVLKRYLVGTPHAAGVASARVSVDPQVVAQAISRVEQEQSQPPHAAESQASPPADAPPVAPPETQKILMECMGCGARLKVSVDKVGKKGKCPKCGGSIRVPGPSVSPEPPPAEPARQEKPVSPTGASSEAPRKSGAGLLQRLADRLNRLPESADILERASASLAKAQGALLAHFPNVEGTVAQKRAVLQTCAQTIDQLAGMRGQNDPRVKLLRAMYAVALASVEGRPEPTEKELGLSSKCFIATAACGNENAADVIRLRAFRDQVLQRSAGGRTWVRAYELLSPPIAGFISNRPLARSLVRRAVVQPAAAIAKRWMQV